MSGRWHDTDDPDNPAKRCWVLSEAIQLLGDGSDLPILNPPLALTTGLDEETHEAAGGEWIVPPQCQAAKASPPSCHSP